MRFLYFVLVILWDTLASARVLVRIVQDHLPMFCISQNNRKQFFKCKKYILLSTIQLKAVYENRLPRAAIFRHEVGETHFMNFQFLKCKKYINLIPTFLGMVIFSLPVIFSNAADAAENAKRKRTDNVAGKPFYYSREAITLIRKSMPQPKPILPMLDKEENKNKEDKNKDDKTLKPEEKKPDEKPIEDRPIKEEPPTPAPDPKLTFDVEVRDGMTLYNQSGWFDMTSQSDNTGLLLTFSKPSTQPIVRSEQYSPVDILSIDKQGKVTQIVPNILLSELEDNIIPQSPILAYLLLKGNICSEKFINVGDEIEYHIFKKPPVIINAPPPQEIPQPPQPPKPPSPVPLGNPQ